MNPGSGSGSKTKLGLSSSKKSVTKPQNSGVQQELAFLWERCQNMKEQFANVVGSLTDREVEQLRYFIMYDKNPTINIVIQMFLIYLGAHKEDLVEDYDFKNIRSISLEALPKDKFKKLDQILKTNKKLTVDSILKINRGLGMLFSMM